MNRTIAMMTNTSIDMKSLVKQKRNSLPSQSLAISKSSKIVVGNKKNYR